MEYEEIISIATDGGKDTERFLTLGEIKTLSKEVVMELKTDMPGHKATINIRTMWKVLKILDFLTDYEVLVLNDEEQSYAHDSSIWKRNDDEAKKAKRDYYRNWRARNPDKVAAINNRFWKKKANELLDHDGLEQCEQEDQWNDTIPKGDEGNV